VTNTRTGGMDLALDKMLWEMAEAVPVWQSGAIQGRPAF
jgi:hypothetical protein